MLFSVKYSPNGKPEVFIETLHQWLHSVYAYTDELDSPSVFVFSPNVDELSGVEIGDNFYLPYSSALERPHLSPAHPKNHYFKSSNSHPWLSRRDELATDYDESSNSFLPPSSIELENLEHSLQQLSTESDLNMQNDIGYVSAILRPNITTSKSYTEAFMKGLDIQVVYEELGERFTMPPKLIEAYRDHLQQKNPKAVFGLEVCLSSAGEPLTIRFTAMTSDGELIAVFVYASKTYTIHYRDRENAQYLLDELSAAKITTDKKITRCMAKKGEIEFLPVNIDGRYRVHDEFYPNTLGDGGMSSIINGFREKTSANLLILAGQWGGGKSALYQAMCFEDKATNAEYYLVDDPEVYTNGDCLTELIERIIIDNKNGKIPYVFLEEGDSFIRDKRENPFLGRMASLTSGAAALQVKIVIATNDTSTNTIAPELLRSARLYAFIKFGTLTPQEANAARRVLNLPEMEFDKDVPLSDAICSKPVITGEASAVTIRKTVGFTQ